MTRTEFIKEVAAKSESTQKAIKEIIEVMQDVAYTEMAAGGEVKIFDSVTLVGKEVPERVCRNPQSGESVVVPQHIAPKAKFGSGIKNLLKEA